MSEWIKCSERFPKDGQKILFLEIGSNRILSGYYDSKSFDQWNEFCSCQFPEDLEREAIEWWMPAPEPPME